jgi:hypothetical protein
MERNGRKLKIILASLKPSGFQEQWSMTHFVVGFRADGSQLVLSSHKSRESADTILRLVCVDSEFIDVRVVSARDWPSVHVSDHTEPSAETESDAVSAVPRVGRRASPTRLRR